MAEPTLNRELIAAMWREHVECNWLSDGVNVRWSCGIIHPGPIHMQPTTRDRHFAALVMTQIEAEGGAGISRTQELVLAPIEALAVADPPDSPYTDVAEEALWRIGYTNAQTAVLRALLEIEEGKRRAVEGQ